MTTAALSNTSSSGNATMTDEVSKITKCLRDVLKEPFFPRVDNDGLLFLPARKMVGTKSKLSRDGFGSDAALRQHVEKFFPNAPIYVIPNPETSFKN